MVSTLEVFTDNSPMSPGPSVSSKNPSTRKSLRQFTEVLDFKHRTDVRGLCAEKLKRKYIRSGSMLWSGIPNSRVYTKINNHIKKSSL